jgi:nucleoside-diphosphate-sugar epimerase
MKILVTGAAGFIGSHMAQTLAKESNVVYGIDNFSNYYDRSLKEQNKRDIESSGVHFIEADLVDDLKNILPSDIEVIYHFAAQPGISASTPFSLYERNNILVTQNLLEWSLSLEAPLKMFVNISTSSVYGLEATSTEDVAAQPASDYGVTKLAAEQLILAAVRMNKLKACSIRLYSVYGPRERPEKLYTKLIKSIIEQKKFPLFEGSEKHLRSFTYVGDIVEGLERVLDNLDRCNGEIINLGNDAVYSTAQGIALVQELLEKKALFKTIPNRSGDQLKTAANINKAKRLLDYAPSTPFKKGLKLQIEWYKDSYC